MKRFFSLMICLMLLMSLVPTASADSNTVTLTVNGDYSGHQYEAYQIFSGTVTTDDKITNVQWGSGITNGDDLLAELKADSFEIVNGLDKTQKTSMAKEFEKIPVDPDADPIVYRDVISAADVAWIMASWQDGRERIDYFANFLYEKGFLNTAKCKTPDTINDKTYIFNLEPGYYLIKDKNDSVDDKHDFYTKFIVELTSSVSASVKGSAPKVTKSVSNTLNGTYVSQTTNAIGVLHYYEWRGTIPATIEYYDEYYYEFVDTLSDGLDFVAFEEIYLDKHNNNPYYYYQKNTVENDSTKPEMSIDKDDDGKIYVKFDNLMADGFPSLLSSYEIVVRYSAMLNEDAVIGRDGTNNEVELYYSNNPHDDDHGKTVPSEARVYSFGLQITKIDGATKNQEKVTTLPGAKFKIYHKHEAESGVGEDLHFAIVNEDGIIEEWTTNEDLASILETNGQGLITVKGLKNKIGYWLREIEAPAGYNLLGRDIKVEITDYTIGADKNVSYIKYEVDGKKGELTGDSAVASIIDAVVENKGGRTLPSTGGMGTTMLYVGGGILVLAALVLLITKKRMANAE